MKFTHLACALVLATNVPTIVHAASDGVGTTVASVTVPSLLELYRVLSGKQVAVSSEVKAERTLVTAKIENKSKAEALKIIEEALAKQAGVEIVHETDGSLTARKIAPKK